MAFSTRNDGPAMRRTAYGRYRGWWAPDRRGWVLACSDVVADGLEIAYRDLLGHGGRTSGEPDSGGVGLVDDAKARLNPAAGGICGLNSRLSEREHVGWPWTRR